MFLHRIPVDRVGFYNLYNSAGEHFFRTKYVEHTLISECFLTFFVPVPVRGSAHPALECSMKT